MTRGATSCCYAYQQKSVEAKPLNNAERLKKNQMSAASHFFHHTFCRVDWFVVGNNFLNITFLIQCYTMTQVIVEHTLLKHSIPIVIIFQQLL